jgi:hypothetical protein
MTHPGQPRPTGNVRAAQHLPAGSGFDRAFASFTWGEGLIAGAWLLCYAGILFLPERVDTSPLALACLTLSLMAALYRGWHAATDWALLPAVALAPVTVALLVIGGNVASGRPAWDESPDLFFTSTGVFIIFSVPYALLLLIVTELVFWWRRPLAWGPTGAVPPTPDARLHRRAVQNAVLMATACGGLLLFVVQHYVPPAAEHAHAPPSLVS